MLENLKPAPKPEPQPFGKPAVEFDGTDGTAVTPGLTGDADFKGFLIEAGYDPEEYEIVGVPRTSKWQRYDGEWLTSYRFRFRPIAKNIDLPLLWANAKKYVPKPATKSNKNTVVVCWADTQTGKSASRGGTQELIERIFEKQKKLEAYLKATKPEAAIFLNVGDVIEGFENTGGQMFTNDLSLMKQVELEASFEWDTLKLLAKYTGNVTAAAIGSNHCQWRRGKDRLGNPLDDWGIHIQRQLALLAQETGTPVKFFEPQPYDESLALPVYDEVIGLVHGHQANRPEGIISWWRGQAHGEQAVTEATILVTGHFHHVRVTETGRKNGRSRWWIQCPTLDNGSDWFRQTSGEDSDPGLLVFTLTEGERFSGTITKL